MKRSEAGRRVKRCRYLNTSEKCVFLMLLEGSDNDTCRVPEFMTPSVAELTEWVALHQRNVYRALAHLDEHGWLNREPGGGRGHKTRYQLVLRPPDDECDHRKRWRQRHRLEPERVAPAPVERVAQSVESSQVTPADARRALKGRGEQGEAEPQHTVTIAGVTEPATVCQGCGDLVPTAWSFDGCHATCEPSVKGGATVIPLRRTS